ncbi:hypothetical protein AB5J62_06445 [Amycolatopsis sp. cg5]|uniref:hypothetical protein n=1 Tax=Amycolatopsis sp. cg5 TaxID=3238802 RepID=UPI00352616F9
MTAGDSYLRNLLAQGTDQRQSYSNPAGAPGAPPRPGSVDRHQQTKDEIGEAGRRERDKEVSRVEDGPPSVWDSIVDYGGAKGGVGGGSGPGGYTFEPEVIAQKITQWQDLLDGIKRDGDNLNFAAQLVGPPSKDQPATKQAEEARTSINAAFQQNQQMQAYAKAYIAALQKANGTYVEQEEVAGSPYGGASDTGSPYN